MCPVRQISWRNNGRALDAYSSCIVFITSCWFTILVDCHEKLNVLLKIIVLFLNVLKKLFSILDGYERNEILPCWWSDSLLDAYSSFIEVGKFTSDYHEVLSRCSHPMSGRGKRQIRNQSFYSMLHWKFRQFLISLPESMLAVYYCLLKVWDSSDAASFRLPKSTEKWKPLACSDPVFPVFKCKLTSKQNPKEAAQTCFILSYTIKQGHADSPSCRKFPTWTRILFKIK